MDGKLPLSPEQFAKVGTADDSIDHNFRSYGYRKLAGYQGGRASGKILGDVEPPLNKLLQADPIQLESNQINKGMSGAAVLDIERNLVVGIISETWFPDSSSKDRDTAWAINTRVLGLSPLSLPLENEALTLPESTRPQLHTIATRKAVVSKPGIRLHNAQQPLAEWVGRERLLKSLTEEWADSDYHVVELTGFAGEGKSSLARRWLDDLTSNSSLRQPDGIFWWGFYEQPNVDEFFQAALAFVTNNDKAVLDRYVSTTARAHLLAGMLYANSYLFILDGLEVVQHEQGDSYGLLKHTDLRDFLIYFAATGHNSFCLLTSRTPVLDLIDRRTFIHHDVDRLSTSEGRRLLRKLGVKGSDVALDKIVEEWEGHPLTLNILAGYVVNKHEGDVDSLKNITVPPEDESQFVRVHHVLHYYDELLNEAERTLLALFSALRRPAYEAGLKRAFSEKIGKPPLNNALMALDDTQWSELLKRLTRTYRILRYDERSGGYSTHPLIRAHYRVLLNNFKPSQIKRVHQSIANYYYNLSHDIFVHFGRWPAMSSFMFDLQSIAPVIELTYHSCAAGNFDAALEIYKRYIDGGDPNLITTRLSAYQTALEILLDFFPDRNTSQNPQVSDDEKKSYILSSIGTYLMNLGRLRESIHFYQRWKEIEVKNLEQRGISYADETLGIVHCHLGELKQSAQFIDAALETARKANDEWMVNHCLIYYGWIASLRGATEEATAAFETVVKYQKSIAPQMEYLQGDQGIIYADHLRRTKKAALARKVAEWNLKRSTQFRVTNVISRSNRVLGDIAAAANKHDVARGHYQEAHQAALEVSTRLTLIEILSARGRWATQRGDLEIADSDLSQALDYAVSEEYKIYEAEIRLGLALLHYARREAAAAQAEAERAKTMSVDMGYYWGQQEAARVLATISNK